MDAGLGLARRPHAPSLRGAHARLRGHLRFEVVLVLDWLLHPPASAARLRERVRTSPSEQHGNQTRASNAHPVAAAASADPAGKSQHGAQRRVRTRARNPDPEPNGTVSSTVIAIDAGTTGVRAFAVDADGQPRSHAYRE